MTPDAFRTKVREWLAQNCPTSMRTPMPDDEAVWGGQRAEYKNPDSRLWLERMAEQCWTAPTWPREYGGGGLSPEQGEVLEEELERINARTPLFSFGLTILGPTLLEFGSEPQKKEHLP